MIADRRIIGRLICWARLAATICLLPLGHLATTAAAQLPAFPGAVGQGAAATGGRGGDVYHVSNLRDYDPHKGQQKIPGSLRHAIRSAVGPRTIVFDVAGPIALAGPLEILKDNLTIAGQTAPGGVTLWGYPTEISRAHDVILRFLRFRVGNFHADGRGNDDLRERSANALDVVNGSERVIVDHVSVAWGIDETLSVTKCRNVTVQHSIIAESLNDASHPKGVHGYGSLVRGTLTPGDQAAGEGGYTFYGNLWAHHRARCPSVGGQQRLDDGQPESERRRTDLNLVNNVIYDWLSQATHRSAKGQVRINIVGNYYINGPTKKADYFFRENNEAVTAVFHAGNMQDADRDKSHDGRLVNSPQGFRDFDEADTLVGPDGAPFSFFSSVEPHVVTAEEAYQRVIATAGASLDRDAIDTRVINTVTDRGGKVIDSQDEYRDAAGRLPGIDDLATSRRPADFDTDRDGMPNEFERAHGLDPSDPDDRNARTLSEEGYTNLEVYLNSLVTDRPQ